MRMIGGAIGYLFEDPWGNPYPKLWDGNSHRKCGVTKSPIFPRKRHKRDKYMRRKAVRVAR